MKTDNELDRITNEIRRLLAEACLLRRRTYETDAAVGAQLLLAKDRVPRGQWLPWLKSNFSLSEDSAQLFMRVHRQSREAPLSDKPLTTNAFLCRYKQLRIDARQESREEERQRAAELAGQDPGRFVVHHADNRKFKWPGTLDIICTDPPWRDLNAYRWLGTFARTHLRVGGLLLVQTGVFGLAEVVSILSRELNYTHCLAIVYTSDGIRQRSQFSGHWCPVLLFARGAADLDGTLKASDVFTAKKYQKRRHEWEQPLVPFYYWQRALSKPNDLVSDPFAGAGTFGVACKLLGGGRRYLATEIDRTHARVAQGRINDAEEGAGLDVRKTTIL